MLLSLSFISLADDFDDEFNGMNSTMNELDMETGSCIPELKVQTERATKMLSLLSKKKSKIAALEGKVDSLTTKLIERSNTQACDTSNLTQKVASLQASNAQLKSDNGQLLSRQSIQADTITQTAFLLAQGENTALRQQIARLKSELILGGAKIPVVSSPIVTTVTPMDAEVVEADWNWTARDFKNRLGQDFAYICPPKGAIYRIHGSDKYTVDSSVCSAAAHMGLITALSGGTVVIRISGNKVGFKASNRNGIQSKRYNQQYQSFVFLK
jgi:hypothetical protein